jgi:uncharacterized membrane protein YphA (DoxX/SURF4 family)
VGWISKHVLGIQSPLNFTETGSGDRTCDYVALLLCAVTAGAATIFWHVSQRTKAVDRKLEYWFSVLIRYYLSFNMLSYGFAKILKLQFPYPSLHRLVEPFGASSPMGLIWAYMGYSSGFNYFMGICELGCGLLLLFRRKTMAGALLAVAITSNIMAVNYFYDVPVKILSTVLMLMSVFLLAPDGRRLIDFFLLNKPVPPSDLYFPTNKGTWQHLTVKGMRWVLISYAFVGTVIFEWQLGKSYGDNAKKPALYGIYEVRHFVINHDTVAPLLTENSRWRKLIVNSVDRARVIMMNDTAVNYNFVTDTQRHEITISKPADSVNRYVFSYTRSKDGNLFLRGGWGKDSLRVSLKRYDVKNFLLVNRGFHWVTEYPFNR